MGSGLGSREVVGGLYLGLVFCEKMSWWMMVGGLYLGLVFCEKASMGVPCRPAPRGLAGRRRRPRTGAPLVNIRSAQRCGGRCAPARRCSCDRSLKSLRRAHPRRPLSASTARRGLLRTSSGDRPNKPPPDGPRNSGTDRSGPRSAALQAPENANRGGDSGVSGVACRLGPLWRTYGNPRRPRDPADKNDSLVAVSAALPHRRWRRGGQRVSEAPMANSDSPTRTRAGRP